MSHALNDLTTSLFTVALTLYVAVGKVIDGMQSVIDIMDEVKSCTLFRARRLPEFTPMSRCIFKIPGGVRFMDWTIVG